MRMLHFLEALAYMVVVVAREAGADVWLGDGLQRRNAFHKHESKRKGTEFAGPDLYCAFAQQASERL